MAFYWAYDKIKNTNEYDRVYSWYKDAVVNRNCLINVPSNTSVFVADNFLLGEVGEDVVLRGSVRAIELAVTLFLLILSIPLWVIATILALFAGKGDIIEKKLRTTNHPAVLFEGGRIGWREVSIPRFRADPTTTAGRWLERTGLRHLPELISVIKGDLALVGTGPLTAEQVSLLNDDWHHQRFQAQAGLTGLWYLNRLNYPDISMTLEEQLIDDSYYAVTRNWKEDVKIFFRSFGVWFKLLFKPGR